MTRPSTRSSRPDPLLAPVEHHDIERVEGPLVFVRDVVDVGYDEYVSVLTEGQPPRHGVVLEVNKDLAIVQVFEGTHGLGRQGTSVAFTGRPLQIPVGDGWLGRVCNGRGEPLDDGPPVHGTELRSVGGLPLNPARREPPHDPILTGVSGIDALTTLVRGQKLPVFSVGGLPHLELAAQIAAQADAPGGAFLIVFAAIGITHTDAAMVRDILEARAGAGELALFVNTADDPIIERMLTPRLALTVAEHFAFDRGRHVLVVMADMTMYCEAVRELAAARGEVPARRGYPGYLYSDLASLYERCGRLAGREGSITQLPVLTMPAGDITHPVPDLTGYITEGQLVLSSDLHAKGVYPPFEALSSLSRLMRKGVGPGRTREDHQGLSSQLYAALARARDIRDLSDLLGAAGLSETDRRYLAFADAFETRFLHQTRNESRSFEETLDRGWEVVSLLPRRELTMVDRDQIDRRYRQDVFEHRTETAEGGV